MISIERYSSKTRSAAEKLSVRPEQAEFTVDKVADFVPTLSELEHPHVILLQERVVGFFILDLSYSEKYYFASEKAIGVRALLVDQQYQGQGIAKQAISSLPDYVKQHYPHFSSIQLTVNCRNKAAYACYLKSGFVDTEALYLGGPVGPQHIMQYHLG